MKIGIVAGSLDPITNGHMFVIEQALKNVDRVHILVAVNSAKRPFFDDVTRVDLARQAIAEALPHLCHRAEVHLLPISKFVAKYAEELGAEFIFRGIRNVVDFEYEHSQMMINQKVSAKVTTMFVMPPAELTAVSSSMIKSMMCIDGWEQIAAEFVSPCVLKALMLKAILSATRDSHK